MSTTNQSPIIITRDYVRQLGACAAGREWFEANYPNGGEYADILDKCYAADRSDWATWLMDAVGNAELTAHSGMRARVSVRFGLPGFVKATIDFIWSRVNPAIVKPTEGDADGYGARIGSSGYGARIGSSGYGAQIGSSGDSARIGSSGYGAQIGSSGDSARIGSSGDSAQIGSSGDSARIGSSGDSAQIGSSGDSARIGSSGYGARIGSSGYGAQIGSSGDSARIGSSGYGARIGSSGYGARINMEGEDSVGAAIGRHGRIRGALGSWITLAEYKPDHKKVRYVPVCVKSAQIDGTVLKADTWYELRNGEFVEAS